MVFWFCAEILYLYTPKRESHFFSSIFLATYMFFHNTPALQKLKRCHWILGLCSLVSSRDAQWVRVRNWTMCSSVAVSSDYLMMSQLWEGVTPDIARLCNFTGDVLVFYYLQKRKVSQQCSFILRTIKTSLCSVLPSVASSHSQNRFWVTLKRILATFFGKLASCYKISKHQALVTQWNAPTHKSLWFIAGVEFMKYVVLAFNLAEHRMHIRANRVRRHGKSKM